MTRAESEGFWLDRAGPAAYERYLVPAFFTPGADQLLRLAAPGPGERALDLACGTGAVARQLAAAVGPGAVTGVDVNPAMLAHATGPGVRWQAADATALPLPDASVDLVCCQQGLQFFLDPTAVLREVRRVLVPDCRIALAVWRSIEHNPVFAGLVEVLDRQVGPAAGAAMRAPFAGPGRPGLRRLLHDAGFADAWVRIGGWLARFPSVREFLRQEAAGSPLGGLLDPTRIDAACADLEQTLAPYVDDAGLILPMQTWLAVAYRPGVDGR